MNFKLSRKYSKLPRSRSTGIALVSVLWLLLLLSGLAATVAYTARVEALLTRRGFDLARAQAAADAAVVNTISKLSDEDAARRPPLGAPQSWDFDGISTTVSVTREAGRINVNAANDELLSGFLQANGVNEDTASTLVKELRTWQGRSAELGTTARSSSLATIEQLRQVPGWHAQNLNCWMGSLTVYSGQADVAAYDATPGALAALRWMQAHHPDSSYVPTSEVSPPASARSVLGDVIRIRASAVASEVTTSSEWVGRLTGDITRPTLTMLWDHGTPRESSSCGKTL
jgi:general secretion pathway protein K